MSDIAIRVEGLSKQYRIGGKQERYKTIRDTLADTLSAPLQRFNRQKAAEENTFWALRDVSFEVKRGEVVGIIGRNGAGKSTLLKILSRITEPTTGTIDIYGRVGSLLEVGTGFHPELSGRENIFLNGAILGMGRKEIEAKFEEIVAFAEVEKFIDTAVKHYSSGMYLRLAFAVAAHLEPEILIVDEVLAVGDAAFQKKCLGKMQDVAGQGRTVLFVSHNMQAVTSLCSSAIYLKDGSVEEIGIPTQIVSCYLKQNTHTHYSIREQIWEDIDLAPGNEKIRIRRICLTTEDGRTENEFFMNTPLKFEIDYWNLIPSNKIFVDLCLYSLDGQPVFEAWTAEGDDSSCNTFPIGIFRTICRIPGNLLNEGTFRIRILFVDNTINPIYNHEEAVIFSVHDINERNIEWFGRYIGTVHPALKWETKQLS